MNKILYILPALAVLGMFSAADADTIQERIERLQERVDRLQERIDGADPHADADRIDKWEAKIDRLQERIAELEARMTQATKSATTTGEPATARATAGDTPQTAATVTITAAGMFEEDAGMIEIPYSDTMTFTVQFENRHDRDHTIHADLISWDFEHQREDIDVPSGQTATQTYTVQSEAPRIGDDRENANIYLVFGAADDPGTPEHEPDTIGGDHAIKISIADPAS